VLGVASHCAIGRTLHPLINALARLHRGSGSHDASHREVEKFQSICFTWSATRMGTPLFPSVHRTHLAHRGHRADVRARWLVAGPLAAPGVDALDVLSPGAGAEPPPAGAPSVAAPPPAGSAAGAAGPAAAPPPAAGSCFMLAASEGVSAAGLSPKRPSVSVDTSEPIVPIGLVAVLTTLVSAPKTLSSRPRSGFRT